MADLSLLRLQNWTEPTLGCYPSLHSTHLPLPAGSAHINGYRHSFTVYLLSLTTTYLLLLITRFTYYLFTYLRNCLQCCMHISSSKAAIGPLHETPQPCRLQPFLCQKAAGTADRRSLCVMECASAIKQKDIHASRLKLQLLEHFERQVQQLYKVLLHHAVAALVNSTRVEWVNIVRLRQCPGSS